jgi:glucose uptake protein GlcU
MNGNFLGLFTSGFCTGQYCSKYIEGALHRSTFKKTIMSLRCGVLLIHRRLVGLLMLPHWDSYIHSFSLIIAVIVLMIGFNYKPFDQSKKRPSKQRRKLFSVKPDLGITMVWSNRLC